MKELLELRKRIKSKMPTFTAQDTHKLKRIRVRWRKPRGMDSKMRQGKKGYRKCIQIGYGSPRAVKGLHRLGLIQNLIKTTNEVEGLDPKKDGVLISGTVGLKKKLEIIRKSRELGLTILNIKDADGYLKQANEMLEKKKAEKAKTTQTKAEKKKELEEKAKQKADKDKKENEEGLADKIESAAGQEEKEKADKEEKNKVLTKKL